MSFLVFVSNMTNGIEMLTSTDDDDDVDVYDYWLWRMVELGDDTYIDLAAPLADCSGD